MGQDSSLEAGLVSVHPGQDGGQDDGWRMGIQVSFPPFAAPPHACPHLPPHSLFSHCLPATMHHACHAPCHHTTMTTTHLLPVFLGGPLGTLTACPFCTPVHTSTFYHHLPPTHTFLAFLFPLWPALPAPAEAPLFSLPYHLSLLYYHCLPPPLHTANCCFKQGMNKQGLQTNLPATPPPALPPCPF